MRPADGQQSFHRMAWLVSVAGLVPFVLIFALLAIARHDNPLHWMLVDFLRFYCAVVLSFLGGVRWGLAYATGGHRRGLLLAVLPALVAVVAGFLPPAPSIAVLLFAFCAIGAWDSLTLYWRPELTGLVRIRVIMTILTAAALFATLFVV
jgi:Protein of unknown function (DUF3429)